MSEQGMECERKRGRGKYMDAVAGGDWDDMCKGGRVEGGNVEVRA